MVLDNLQHSFESTKYSFYYFCYSIQITGQEMVLIDFVLPRSVPQPEDKGEDLYVLQRAIKSSHADVDYVMPEILKAYRECDTVQTRLKSF
uniref:non-specific serine/threonine protein kinase n=1 Tax=Ditylenchus dipsaci TaxID=166011 RepID=A0A915D0H3_9BILA